MACPEIIIDDCGCAHQHSAKCVFYRGTSALSCIDVTNGDDLETALININEAVCNLTPSGSITIVESCNDDIEVTSSTVGTATTYTICLNSDITDNIQENTDNIADLFACLNNTVADIVSDTITVTEDSSGDCGRTIRIEFSPSGTTVIDGIIENDTTVYSADGTGGSQVLKSSTYNLTDDNLLTTGDNVLLLAEGQYAFDESATGLSDTITLEIRNAGVTRFSISNSAPRSVPKYGWRIEVTYTVTGTTTGQVTVFYWQNLVANGTEAIASSGLPKTIFSKAVTGMDYTAFNWRIVDVNDSELGATYNFLNHFQAEVRKNIS